ncbi:lipoprotein LipO [Anaerocolumna cellulosilytica]|uniref:Lipoprotein LipO n=1 Tax=Anaerocolumna cellulosilytica TaxID=433286 RepID=A0A6S6R817_9FIRM|nr:extracellular solute-binding protein [Anaerocolumna cellulosilytica]MBB5194968.1 putative aldouronate transport system substrate-binding protein [Anaerocolumna cellulosilytica]BCJ96197.1 lipoprotein LipO [Anaerocolumna cellulosilytica]
MKRRSVKKALALFLVTAMAAGSLAGCGNTSSNNGGKETNTPGTEGAAERPTISMMTFDFEGSPVSGEHSEDVIKKMEDYTNTKVNFSWVPSDNYEDKLSLTLASANDMPMIIAVGNMTAAITGAAEAGAFWDLNEFMFDAEKYPNLSQANENVNKSLTVNGQLIGIYRARDIGRNGMGYRADWAEKLGLEEPKTIEDVYNMMYAFTYNDPDGNGKNDTYGLALSKYTGPFDIIQTWFGVGNGWVEQDGKLVPVHQTEEYLEAAKWLKKMYDDGLVYKDWAVRDTATWQDSVKNGECGMFIDVLDGSRRIWDYFVNNNVPSVVDASQPASMNLVGSINNRTLATSGYNGFFVITKAADTEEKVAACLNYLDKMCDDDMMILSSYGLEGIHWEIGEDGNLVDLDAEDAVASKAYAALNQTVASIPNMKPTKVSIAKTERNILEEAVKQANIDKAVFNPASAYLVNSATYSLSGATLDQLLMDTRTQFICGEIDEAGLKKAWQQWLDLGGASVIEEVNAQYTAN